MKVFLDDWSTKCITAKLTKYQRIFYYGIIVQYTKQTKSSPVFSPGYSGNESTGRMGWMAQRKWKEIKQQPGTAGPGNMLGCCFISFHFRCDIHPIRPVQGGPTEFYSGNLIIFYAVRDISFSILSMTSLKHHISYFHFRCKIQLDLPVGVVADSERKTGAIPTPGLDLTFTYIGTIRYSCEMRCVFLASSRTQQSSASPSTNLLLTSSRIIRST